MRLDKYLGFGLIGTKKAVKGYIYQGNVKVNGTIIYQPSYIIDEQNDVVKYVDKEIKGIEKKYFMFNKPQGCITARSDATDKTVFDYFEGIDTSGLFAVGRLDKETEGLLIITNDGDLNHFLMHPNNHINKTYYFWAFGTINSEDIKSIENGVDIGEKSITKPSKLAVVEQGLHVELEKHMEDDGCKFLKKNNFKQDVVSGYITISQGMKHQVKKMLKQIGCHVVFLKRVSIGNLILDENLGKGEHRIIPEKELWDKIY